MTATERLIPCASCGGSILPFDLGLTLWTTTPAEDGMHEGLAFHKRCSPELVWWYGGVAEEHWTEELRARIEAGDRDEITYVDTRNRLFPESKPVMVHWTAYDGL